MSKKEFIWIPNATHDLSGDEEELKNLYIKKLSGIK